MGPEGNEGHRSTWLTAMWAAGGFLIIIGFVVGGIVGFPTGAAIGAAFTDTASECHFEECVDSGILPGAAIGVVVGAIVGAVGMGTLTLRRVKKARGEPSGEVGASEPGT